MIKKELAETKNNNLLKSNLLINANCKLTILSAKLLYLALFTLQQNEYVANDDKLIVKMSASQLKEIMGKENSNSLYERVRKASKNLMGTYISYENPEDNHFKYSTIITSTEYKNNELIVKFDSDIRQFITKLSETGNYTLLNREILMSFSTITAFRLYEILKSECFYNKNFSGKRDNVFVITKELSQLKFMLGIYDACSKELRDYFDSVSIPDYAHAESLTNSCYIEWDNFKRRHLLPAIEEINSGNNSMFIEYETLKNSSHAVDRIKFTVKIDNKITALPERTVRNIKEENAMVFNTVSVLLSELNLEESQISKICEAADCDINKCIKAYKVLINNPKNISNPIGFLIEAIKENWEPSEIIMQNKKKEFNLNREYNFEDLERKIVSNIN